MARSSMAPLVVLGTVAGIGVVGLGLAGLALSMSGGPGVSGEAAEIVRAYGIPPELAIRVVNVAREVGTHPYWLADLLHFESAGKWSSSVQNESSKATGPLQITPYAAGLMGTDVEHLKGLSEARYMDWAQYYLELVRGGYWQDDPVPVPLNTLQRLTMSVYHPPSRNIPLDAAHRAVPSGPNKGWKPTGTPGGYIGKMLDFGGRLTPLVAA